MEMLLALLPFKRTGRQLVQSGMSTMPPGNSQHSHVYSCSDFPVRKPKVDEQGDACNVSFFNVDMFFNSKIVIFIKNMD